MAFVLQSLRSKTQVRDNFGGTLEECPMWPDGSSTEQADGSSSTVAQTCRYLPESREIKWFSGDDQCNADIPPRLKWP